MTILLLSGIALNALVGAGIGLLTFLATEEELRSLTFWTLGGFSALTWRLLLVGVPFAFLAFALLLPLARPLNALALGEREAFHLGIDLERLKRRAVAGAALGVGVAVALAGGVGFLGLVAPHLFRLLAGPDHRYLLPGSALLGGSLAVLADLLARTLAAPAEIPVGVVTALLGGLSSSTWSYGTSGRCTVLKVQNLGYRVGERWLLRGVDLAVGEGEFLAVLGPNGSGKTTLLRLLAGELRPTEGEVFLLGEPLAVYGPQALARQRAVLSQVREMAFPYTAYEVAFLGRLPHLVGRERPLDHRKTPRP